VWTLLQSILVSGQGSREKGGMSNPGQIPFMQNKNGIWDQRFYTHANPLADAFYNPKIHAENGDKRCYVYASSSAELNRDSSSSAR
jgi:hypothetical protein